LRRRGLCQSCGAECGHADEQEKRQTLFHGMPLGQAVDSILISILFIIWISSL
jgi:hypothetical protein